MPSQSDQQSKRQSNFDGLIAYYPTPPGNDLSGAERERIGRKLSELGIDADTAGVLDAPVCEPDERCLDLAADEVDAGTAFDREAPSGSDAEDARMMLRLGGNGF